MTANAPLLRATSMYPRREFLEPLGQTARRLRAIVAEVKAQDALAPGDRKSNGLFHRLRPPPHAPLLPPCPLMPAPAAGQRWMPPAGRRLAAHGQEEWLGTGSLHGWSCSGRGCRG